VPSAPAIASALSPARPSSRPAKRRHSTTKKHARSGHAQ
jgi:hypothetical protein